MKKGIKIMLYIMLIIATLAVSHYYKEANHKAEEFMAFLVDNYYDRAVLEEAIKAKLGDDYDENIYKNYDDYVIELILADINQYESERIATYNRFFSKDELTVLLEKMENRDQAFDYYSINDDIPYIYINGFIADDTYDHLKEALSLTGGQEQLIIDLRDNSGGSMSELTKMLDEFIPEDQILFKYDNSEEPEEIIAKKDVHENLRDLKSIVILMNEGTASASEVMIQSLRSYFDVELVGEKSRGKYFSYGLKKYIDQTGTIFVTNEMIGAGLLEIPPEGIEPDHLVVSEEEQLKKAIELLGN